MFNKSVWKITSILAIITCSLYGQEIQKPDEPDSVTQRVTIGKPKFTPFIAPVYTPEVDLMLTIGGLFTFKVNVLDSILQRSSVPFSVGYSTNGSFSVNFRPYIYGKNDKWRIFGNLWLKNMPDNYWGVGYQNGKNVMKSDSTTAYQRFWWQLDFNFIRKVAKNLFAGVKLDLNKTEASDLNPRMVEDEYVVRQGTEFKNSGIGGIIQYDSRDFTVNAYSGLYVSLSATAFRSFLHGTTNYNEYLLDYRQYKQIKRPGRTIAWQIKMELNTDDVPWTDMAMLGTPFDLRGYISGRYRDKSVTLGIVEYRHMFMRKTPNKKGSYKSKHGFVTWVGTGAISPLVRKSTDFLPNVGIGYRFEIQDRMNARIDFGIGEDSRAFYVSFNEAF